MTEQQIMEALVIRTLGELQLRIAQLSAQFEVAKARIVELEKREAASSELVT